MTSVYTVDKSESGIDVRRLLNAARSNRPLPVPLSSRPANVRSSQRVHRSTTSDKFWSGVSSACRARRRYLRWPNLRVPMKLVIHGSDSWVYVCIGLTDDWRIVTVRGNLEIRDEVSVARVSMMSCHIKRIMEWIIILRKRIRLNSNIFYTSDDLSVSSTSNEYNISHF